MLERKRKEEKRKKSAEKKLSLRLIWRHRPDLNWSIKVLQTSALPLGYGANNKAAYKIRPFLERDTRFELATFTLAR